MDSEFHIGWIAKQLGVSSTYLRRLERQKRILPARRDPFGNRIYSEFDLMLLRELGIGTRSKRLKRAEDVLEARQ
jgi:DNA-binding transcriptional MerR regulator